MQGLLNNIKKYFALGLLLIFLFIILWIKLFISPKLPPASLTPTPIVTPSIAPPQVINYPSPIIERSPNLSGTSVVKYTGTKITPPSTISLSSIEKPAIITLDQALVISSKFGFSGQPSLNEQGTSNAPFFLWQTESGSKVLSIGGSIPVLKYNNYGVLTTGITNPKTNNDLVNKTKETLDLLGLSNVDFNSPVFHYYTKSSSDQFGSFYLNEVFSVEEASYIGIGLTYQIGGFGVISNSVRRLPLFIIFNKNGELYELTAYIAKFIPSSLSIVPLPFSDVLKKLNSDSIIFDALSQTDVNGLDIPQYKIQEIDLNSVEIKYYMPIRFNDYIRPYYVFKGKGSDEETGKVVEITILQPV